MSDFEGVDHLTMLAQLSHKYVDQYGDKWGVSPDDPPMVIPTSNAWGAWRDAGYQASRMADDLEQALNRLLDSDGGWKGEAADTYRDKADQIVRFIRQWAHVADSDNEAPDTGGGGDDGPDTGGFGDGGSGEGKSYKQLLEESVDAFVECSARKCEPPPWWETPMGLWGEGRDGDATYTIVRRAGGDGDPEPYGAGGVGPEIQAQMMHGEDGSGGYWAAAGVYGLQPTGGEDHYFPHDPDENADANPDAYQKLWLHLGINSDAEENTRRAGNNLAETYRDLAGRFAPAPTPPQIGVDTDQPGDFGGGGGGGQPDPPNPDPPNPDPPNPDPPNPDPPNPDPPNPDPPNPDPPNPDPPNPDPPNPDPPDDPPPPDPPDDPDDPDDPDPPPPPPPPPDPPDNPDDPDDPVDPDPPPPPPPPPDPPPEPPGDPEDPDDDPPWDLEDPREEQPPIEWPRGDSDYDPETPDGGDDGTDLSRNPGGSGPYSGPGGSGGGAGGAGAGTGAGGTGSAGTGGSGSGGAGTGPAAGAGAAGAGGAGAGTAGGAAGTGGAGAGTRGGMGGMMAPMMGGGGGQQGQGDQAERDTWLAEEDDVWGVDDDGEPPVIGGTM